MKEASKVVVIREAKLKDLGDMRGELSIRASVVDYKDDVIAQSQLPIYLNGVKIDTILSDGNGHADYLWTVDYGTDSDLSIALRDIMVWVRNKTHIVISVGVEPRKPL